MKDQPVLAEARVRQVGDPVALVVATSPEAAAAALPLDRGRVPSASRRVRLPTTRSPTAPRRSIPAGNLLAENWLRSGDIAEGFARADVVVENTYTTPWNEHAYLEPEAALAFWDGETLVVRTSTQYSHYHRAEVARTLGLPVERVRVVPTVSGGAFGGKTDISCQCLVALATAADGPAGPDRLQPRRVLRVDHETAPLPDPRSKRRHARRRPHRPPGRHACRHRGLRLVRTRAHGQDVRLGDRSLPLAARRAARPGGLHEQPDGRLHARSGDDAGRVRHRVADGPARRPAGHGSARIPGAKPPPEGRPAPVGPGPRARPGLRRDPGGGPAALARGAGAVRRVGRSAGDAAPRGGRGVDLVRHRRRGRRPDSRPGSGAHGGARPRACRAGPSPGRIDRRCGPARRTSARGPRPPSGLIAAEELGRAVRAGDRPAGRHRDLSGRRSRRSAAG